MVAFFLSTTGGLKSPLIGLLDRPRSAAAETSVPRIKVVYQKETSAQVMRNTTLNTLS
jgi:hypothetical protein